jgi:hypothetical protein
MSHSRAVRAALDSGWASALMLLVTAYALFGDDIRLNLPEWTDPVFLALSSLTLVLFTTEMMLQAVAVPGYLPIPAIFDAAARQDALAVTDGRRSPRASLATVLLGAQRAVALVPLCAVGSFYFWLDALAVTSIAVEIAQILYDHGGAPAALVGALGSADPSGGGAVDAGAAGAALSSSAVGLNFVRAGRAARVGARLGRLLRLLQSAMSPPTGADGGGAGHGAGGWAWARHAASLVALLSCRSRRLLSNGDGTGTTPTADKAVNSSVEPADAASGAVEGYAGADAEAAVAAADCDGLPAKPVTDVIALGDAAFPPAEPPPAAAALPEAASAAVQRGTRVGAALTDLLTRRVIFGAWR